MPQMAKSKSLIYAPQEMPLGYKAQCFYQALSDTYGMLRF